jgi:phosphatidylethanolamine-binding protein (PEBP) family uncharacterized protein
MEIYYKNKYLNKDNIFLTPQETYEQPIIKLTNLHSYKTYCLIMFDPDAVGGNKIHWLVTNITDNDISNGNVLIKYKGPAPPKGSGIHHYVFCLLEQKTNIPIKNYNFNSRFIELTELFKKLYMDKKNVKILDIRYFVSKN